MDPSLSFDLNVPRADITFDNFRIRDAELLRQGFHMMQEELNKRNTSFGGVIADVISHAAFHK